MKDALLALLSGPAEWYAAQLKKALCGQSTNDKTVCRIIGAHDKEEVKTIAAAFDKKYGVSLKKAIAAECSGNRKRDLEPQTTRAPPLPLLSTHSLHSPI